MPESICKVKANDQWDALIAQNNYPDKAEQNEWKQRTYVDTDEACVFVSINQAFSLALMPAGWNKKVEKEKRQLVYRDWLSAHTWQQNKE